VLVCLDQELRERHADREVELWRKQKGERRLRCIAVYVSTAIDLRLLEGSEMRRTHLFTMGIVLLGAARRWQRGLRETGWRDGEAILASRLTKAAP
jgi:hypothetical protein